MDEFKTFLGNEKGFEAINKHLEKIIDENKKPQPKKFCTTCEWEIINASSQRYIVIEQFVQALLLYDMFPKKMLNIPTYKLVNGVFTNGKKAKLKEIKYVTLTSQNSCTNNILSICKKAGVKIKVYDNGHYKIKMTVNQFYADIMNGYIMGNDTYSILRSCTIWQCIHLTGGCDVYFKDKHKKLIAVGI